MQALFAITQPMTRFVVGKYNSSFAAVGALVDGGGANRSLLVRVGDTAMQINPGGIYATPITTGSWHIYTMVMNLNPSFLRVDGVSLASGDGSGQPDVAGATQGAYGNLVSNPGNPSIAEDIMFARNLSLLEIALVEGYLRERYGL
jgi:hypothetical protein